MFEEIDDLLQFILRLLATGDIAERYPRLLFSDQPGFALAKTQNRLTGAAQTPPDKRPNQNHDADGDDPGKKELGHQVRALPAELHVRSLQFVHELRIFYANGAKKHWLRCSGCSFCVSVCLDL